MDPANLLYIKSMYFGYNKGFRAEVKALCAHPGVTRLRLPRGQVLLYAGHLPSGLFLLLSGAVQEEGGGETEPLPAPRLLPDPGGLERPLPRTVRIAAQAELLYLPRSVALASPALCRRLQRLVQGRPHLALVPPDPDSHDPTPKTPREARRDPGKERP